MQYRKIKDTVYIRIDKEEYVIKSILDVCKKENIETGYFQGIGACDRAVLATWIPEKEDFIQHTLTGMLEMISLMGNITLDQDKKPYSHSHGVFSFLDENGQPKVAAGHLEDARIGYTGEVVLNTANEKIGRMFCPKAGIDVWDLDKN